LRDYFVQGRRGWVRQKLGPTRITKARKLIEAGERVEDVAPFWNVGRTTLYRALGRIR
jgi:hypothetical protein